MWLLGIENLKEVRQAFIVADLNNYQVKDIFFKNANMFFIHDVFI